MCRPSLGGAAPIEAVAQLVHMRALPAETLEEHPGLALENNPAAQRVYAIGLFAATLADDIRENSENLPDAALALSYAMKAYMINLHHDLPSKPWAFHAPEQVGCVVVQHCGDLFQLAKQLTDRIAEADRLADSVRSLPGTREQLLAGSVGVVSLVLRGFETVVLVDPSLPIDPDLKRSLRAFERVARSLASEDYATAVLTSLAFVDSLGIMNSMPLNVRRVLSLTADLAQAQDADGVAASLDRFAAPPESYLTKRASGRGAYVLLNAYAGAGFGREGVCPRLAGCRASANVVGAYMPLGLEVGVPISSRVRLLSGAFRSASVFVQVIDLGTLATWRLAERDGVDKAPNVGFDQVFAPGAHIVLGVRGLPVSVGYGISVAPRLRKVATEGGVVREENVIRKNSLFVAVDIPLFP